MDSGSRMLEKRASEWNCKYRAHNRVTTVDISSFYVLYSLYNCFLSSSTSKSDVGLGLNPIGTVTFIAVARLNNHDLFNNAAE